MNLERCRECRFYKDIAVFELCTHPTSAYYAMDKDDFHSIQHMRKFSCGEIATNFRRPAA